MQRKLTLIFKNDVLVRTEGEYFAETPQDMLKASQSFEGNYKPNTESAGANGDMKDAQSGGGN